MSLKNKKNFSKSCISVDDQIKLLQARGLKFQDLTKARNYLVAGAKLHKKLEKIPDKWFI